jgi:predicted HAD superfamily Cof-like phosphohydrolase
LRNRFVEAVEQFHEAFDSPKDVRLESTGRSKYAAINQMRFNLMFEELGELTDAMHEYMNAEGDGQEKAALEVIDAITDLLYVVIGFAVTFGIDIETAFERVHSSNMSKLGRDGKPLFREDGKVMKGPDFMPPVLEDLVRLKGGLYEFVKAGDA